MQTQFSLKGQACFLLLRWQSKMSYLMGTFGFSTYQIRSGIGMFDNVGLPKLFIIWTRLNNIIGANTSSQIIAVKNHGSQTRYRL